MSRAGGIGRGDFSGNWPPLTLSILPCKHWLSSLCSSIVNLLEAGLATSLDPAFEVLLGILAQRLNTPPKTRLRGFSSSRSGRRMQRGPSTPPRATGYRAHPYNISLGRPDWQSRDPIGENGGMDLYSYVENNSVNHIDAFGLSGGTGRHDYCPINKPPLPGSPGPAQYGEVLGGAACVATLPFAIPAAAVGYDAAGLAIVLNPTYQYIISSPTTQQLIWAGLSVFGISSCQQPTAPAQILPLIIKDINQNNTGNGGKNCPSK